jgi:hypothetical protein
MDKRPKIGIVQSRGLGDIVIALPIARHYYNEGYEVYWPIAEHFVPNFQQHVPWVRWVPVPYDPPGRYFYDVPVARLKNLGVTELLPLYQHLTGHDFATEKYFQYTKFDQYKYIRAGVPFLDKWKLAVCIEWDTAEEDRVYNTLIKADTPYVVVHLEGSDHRAAYDPAIIPAGWNTVEITEGITASIFNWRRVIQGAEAVVMVDSVMSNLVDQMGWGSDRYFIQRSHVGLTPVQGHHWTWI